ncbi:MAG: toxic anion resistance protein [Lachnospiraceae bacterium]|nr:toxic anion resistance protein [Lachnospiraceae bacterium]MBQ3902660.1 toxic anion resistance protein [Lachnospiraceae bacterium]MCR5211862.1 toxic anion resistance protein [Lachnospiraceae bacterium]
MDNNVKTEVKTEVKEEISELDRIFMEAGQNTSSVPSTTVNSAKTIDIPVTELTEEEQKQVDDIADKLDVTDAAAVMAFGAGTQQKMAEFSERTLESVRTKDMGEVGDMITNLVGELKNFDVDENEKGLFAFFKKGANKIQNIKTKYSKVETNVKTIQNELEKRQVTLLKDVDLLNKLYDLNLKYFKELSLYILGGKKKLEEIRNGELVEAQKKAAESGLPEDAQRAKDIAAQCDRLEKKLYDLELSKTIALQTGPQIRMVQSSDTAMAEKIQSTIVNTIPLWKNQMVIAIGIEHSSQAAKAEREVNDMTNALLKKNADKLKVATIESAKESERGIVDIETLKHTNEQLISTLDEVLRIQEEGKQKRAAAEVELVNIENELKQKLLEASKK